MSEIFIIFLINMYFCCTGENASPYIPFLNYKCIAKYPWEIQWSGYPLLDLLCEILTLRSLRKRNYQQAKRIQSIQLFNSYIGEELNSRLCKGHSSDSKRNMLARIKIRFVSVTFRIDIRYKTIACHNRLFSFKK